MILDTLYNDITSIKVLVINKTATSKLDHLLIKDIQLKQLIPHFKNNNEIENKDDYTTFLNPSYYPESFLKFEYMSNSQNIEELLIYHDLEPWRNQLVALTIVDNNTHSDKEDSIIDNVYHKTIDINELNDMTNYYTICQNVFEILKNYIKSLSYMKLKSPNNFMMIDTDKITYLNNSKKTDNTYYQITKAKYKINNMDMSIQLRSRKLKYISNILILAGQYKKALEVLDECVLDFYKNGDFLWLSNSLEMVIFCLLNVIAINDDTSQEVHVPKCVDYLIAYDKHILIKTKIMKNVLKQVETNGSSNRDSLDLEHAKHETHEKGHKNVMNLQSLVFLIVQIYEKLIHYLEYTYDEVDNYATPNILNNFMINYLWVLHQSIVNDDLNSFLESVTKVKVEAYDEQYLQPVLEDLVYQFKKYEMFNIFKCLHLHDSLRFMNLHLNMIDVLKNEKTLVLKFFYFIDKFKQNDEFIDDNLLKKRVFEKLYNLIYDKLIDNKLILKKLVVIIIKYCNNDDIKSNLASLSLQNHTLFNAEEQQLIISNLKYWVNERNTCLLKSFKILKRSDDLLPLPKIENLVALEQDDVVDEVYNPFRNKVYTKDEVVEYKHCYIENEIISVQFTFKNYSKIDLNLVNVIINDEKGENTIHFEQVNITQTKLAKQSDSVVTINFKCLNNLADTYIDINQFEFKFEELEQVVIKNVRPYEKNHSKNCVLIIPEIPILKVINNNKLLLDNDCVNNREMTIKRMNKVQMEVFDINVHVNDYSIHKFFNKKKLNKSEHELYDYMLSQFHKSINIKDEITADNLNLNIVFNFKDFKVASVTKFDIQVEYGMVIDNTRYVSKLVIPLDVDYRDSLIIPNFEILPFNLIPSEQISLPTDSESGETAQEDNSEAWINFLESNNDYKWILLLNLRNISTSPITLKSIYQRETVISKEAFQNESIVIKQGTNRKVMIPIEASLFNNIGYTTKTVGYNILMNFEKYLKLEYTMNDSPHKLNILSNLKLEDCYNSQKLVNRQDILISMDDGINTFRVGESKRIKLEPKVLTKKDDTHDSKKTDNMLISLMVLDIITSEDVLEKESIVLINGMRTFNIDRLDDKKKINLDILFTVPGSYEINCLCEIGDDPSSVVKYFGTRALTVRVVE